MVEKDENKTKRILPDRHFTLKTIHQELKEAYQLINRHHFSDTNPVIDTKENFSDNISLLERCRAVTEQDKNRIKPTLRVIHHFACSGGTLISKCIAAQLNVFLLSELHPTTRHGFDSERAQFTPRDVVTQAIYSRIPDVDTLAKNIFVKNIIETEKHVRRLGGYLVLRAHSHSDYCTCQPLPNENSIQSLLEPHFNIKNLVTIRDPIDSFLSLRENKWVHFTPNIFDEYCRRFLIFIESLPKAKIIKYENFVVSPDKEMIEINEFYKLGIPISNLDDIDIYQVSGDSGRQGVEIKPRKRKEISKDFKSEILNSNYFKLIVERFNYGL